MARQGQGSRPYQYVIDKTAQKRDWNKDILRIYERQRTEGVVPGKSVARDWWLPDYKLPEVSPPQADNTRRLSDNFSYQQGMDNWRQNEYRQQMRGQSVRGPLGEQLPYGAESWDYNGRPFYGGSFAGIWNKFRSRLSAPFEEGTEGEPTIAGQTPGGASFNLLDAPKIAAAGWSNMLQTWENINRGTAGAPLAMVSRFVGGGVEGLLGTMGEVEKTAEQALSVEKEAFDIAYEQRWGEKAAEGEWYPRAQRWKQFISKVPEDIIRQPAPELTPEQKKKRYSDAWYAGRVLYSGAFDADIRQNFIRKVESGENPYLVALELENPWAEAAGTMILSPWNVLAPYTKAMRDARRSATVYDDFLRAAPEVEAFVKTAPGMVDEAGYVEKLVDATTTIRNSVAKVTDGSAETAINTASRLLTQDGKRAYMGRRLGEMIQGVVYNNNIDDAMDSFEALYRMASGNEDEIALGLTMVKELPMPNALTSRVGQETGVILRRIIGETQDEWDDFIKLIGKAEDEADLATIMGRKLDDALADMYPNFQDLTNAARKAAKAAGEIDDKTARLAAMYQQKPWLYKGIGNFHRIAQDKVYKPINSFFNAVYLGLSPGYAFRNLTQNTVGVLVDSGAGALRYKPTTWLDRTKRWLGGVIPEGAGGFSKGTAGVEVYGSGKLPANIAAEWAERQSAAQVVGKSVQDEMSKMLRVGRAIPDTRPLIEAGMPPEAAKTLVQSIVTEYGDVEAGVARFLEQYKTGRVDLFRSLGFLSDAQVKQLKQFNVWDEIVDIARNGADDEAMTVKEKITAVFDDVFQDALRVEDEAATVDVNAPGADAILHSLDDIGDGGQTVATNAIQANKLATQNGTEAVLKTLEGAAVEAQRAGSEEVVQSIQKLQAEFQQTITDMSQTHLSASQWGDEWHEWKEAIDAAHDATTPEKTWATLAQQTELPDVFDTVAPGTWDDFNRRFWIEYFYPKYTELYQPARAALRSTMDNIAQTLGDNPLLRRARVDIETADGWQDLVYNYQKSRFAVQDALKRGDNFSAVLATAEQYGIPSKAPSGALLDKRIVDTINKYMETSYSVEDLRTGKITVKEANKAFGIRQRAKAAEKVAQEAVEAAPEAQAVVEEIDVIPPVIPPNPATDITPSMARVLTEQRDGLQGLLNQVLDGVTNNWGKYKPVVYNPRVEKRLTEWAALAKSQVGEARIMAAAVADEARKFTLLNYPEKTYLDLALAYIYPYQFWYSRTYANWLRRIAYNPDVVANYARYKDGLAKIHAGAPDWWKYNINSNELLGRDDENPLFFNLEATLNPLNGITGVDFQDPYKRVDWFTRTVDDMGKYGPSVWTPINLGIATVFHLKGQQELAARWGGRLIPQTAPFKAGLSMFNVNLKTAGGVNELDPAVQLFSGGQDPYERNRTARQLYEMQQEGLITQEEADETAFFQDNQTWFDATARAIRQRAPGQLSSFLFGVGFKGRNQSDIQLDIFDQANRRLINMRETMSPDEYRQARAELNAQFPFADAVLLARRGGDERDTSYAYNVLGRIPPGQKNDMLELVGINRDMMTRFYDDKGNFSDWAKADRDRFMAAVVDLGGYFQLPDDATKAEWDGASKAYRDMVSEGERLFGSEIWDAESRFYDLNSQTGLEKEKAQVFLERTPNLQEAMDWKAQEINRNPLLRQYYGSIESIERYYTGMMYDVITQELGDDIFDLWDEYYEIKLVDSKEAKKFYKQNENRFERYSEMKGNLEQLTSSAITRLGSNIKDVSFPELRPREQTSLGQQSLDEYFAGQQVPTPYDYTWTDWQANVSQNMERLLVDYFNGEDLSYAAQDQLEYIANQMDIDPEVMLRLMQDSYYR